MVRKMAVLLCAAMLIAGGCAKRAQFNSPAGGVDEATTWGSTKVVGRLTAGPASFSVSPLAYTALAASRYLAVRHKLVLVTGEAELPKALQAVVSFCGTIQCEVVSSNISSQTAVSAPSGSVTVRVRPGDVDKLIAFVEKQGKVAQHSTETEDKTAAVVDTDARIKNLTDFRDTLRKMLARPAVSVADLVQIQEKLADTQAQLDGEAASRKILANETEKVAIDIDFRAERMAASVSAFRPIADAVRESASVLADSIASLITVVVAVIPWLILVVPGVWALVKAWRRMRKRRAQAKEAQTP